MHPSCSTVASEGKDMAVLVASDVVRRIGSFECGLWFPQIDHQGIRGIPGRGRQCTGKWPREDGIGSSGTAETCSSHVASEIHNDLKLAGAICSCCGDIIGDF